METSATKSDASKAALSAFSEAMALDLWDSGIKVLVVYPGLVDTELFSLPDGYQVVPILCYHQFGAGNRAQAIMKAIQAGLIQPESNAMAGTVD